MKLKILVLSAVMFCTFKSHSQGRQMVYLEGMGAGIFATANFDMRFKKDAREGLGFRAGIGNSSIAIDESITTIPVGINYVYGKKRSALLLGANAAFGLYDIPKGEQDGNYSHFVPSLEIGYRFRPMTRGVAFQVTYNPLFNTVDGTMPAYFGVGIGYSWK